MNTVGPFCFHTTNKVHQSRLGDSSSLGRHPEGYFTPNLLVLVRAGVKAVCQAVVRNKQPHRAVYVTICGILGILHL